MAEPIDRQQAIDAMTDELDMIDHVPQWVFNRLEKRLKQLPYAQPEQRWIPCSERLPKTDNWRTEYIVTYDRGYKEDAELKTTCMSWENTIVRGKPVSRWIWHDRLSPWKVVAWMPLPKPYEMEGDAE